MRRWNKEVTDDGWPMIDDRSVVEITLALAMLLEDNGGIWTGVPLARPLLLSHPDISHYYA